MADTITQTSTISMEIINSEQYKRANIRFSEIPSEEVRTELKNEGWLYSRNHNEWYPRNIAAENSMEFAKHIKQTYFPKPQKEVNIVTEAFSTLVMSKSSFCSTKVCLHLIFSYKAVRSTFIISQYDQF